MKFGFYNLGLILLSSLSMNLQAFAMDEQKLISPPWQKQDQSYQQKTILKGNIQEEIKQVRPLTGIGVIGLRFIHQNGYPSYIEQIYPNSPASKAGLKPSDLIFAIDGVRTDKLSSDSVYQLLAGSPGSRVKIFITRGQSMFNVEMLREDLANFPSEVQNNYLSGPVVVPIKGDFFPYH